ncbi:MAG: YlxR family protein, partial [Acidimicrobiales bacterium]
MVCRARRPDVELCRAGRGEDGSWYLGRGVGRGVWWCRDRDCGSRLRWGAVARALRSPVSAADVD